MSLLTSEQINHKFLLLAHMVCADGQIHNEEVKVLRELGQHAKVGMYTIEEMEKILSQDEKLISIEEVLCQIPPSDYSEAMRQILAIAYIDGYCSPLERELINKIAEFWSFSAAEVEILLENASSFGSVKRLDNEKQVELSFGARLLKGSNSILSRALIDKLAKIAPENVGRKIEKIKREILLGPEYDEAISKCAKIAFEDYKFAEVALKKTDIALNNLGRAIQEQVKEIQRRAIGKGKAKTANEVAQQLEDTRKALTVEIRQEIERVRESLASKQRALKHFSIAFMGKTKAGKSTLHAIITGGGWDAIGVGKQRTTRLNRVYEWKNIRIIDTPGIGAPGGKTDEEIAASVIEESDVICYIVTNDSIQESEFQFLKHLKGKSKPLIILLNVMNNLRDSRRLEYFLKNPDKLFAMDGQSGLGGHIERIKRYAKQHYINDYFDIVPVMLLAAQMSQEAEHEHRKEELFQASRMQDFLDSIRESLVEHGTIRRSQTLLGSTVGAIDKPYIWSNQEAQSYHNLGNNLKKQRQNICRSISRLLIVETCKAYNIAYTRTLRLLKEMVETGHKTAVEVVTMADILINRRGKHISAKVLREWKASLGMS